MYIRAGNTVVVISGKERGKTGKVIRVYPKENKAIVEKINIVKKHVRPSPRFPQGGIVETEAKIHVSKLMLVCPRCGKGTRVGRRFMADGKKVRYCKKCGELID